MDPIGLLERFEGSTLEFNRGLSSPEGTRRILVTFAGCLWHQAVLLFGQTEEMMKCSEGA